MMNKERRKENLRCEEEDEQGLKEEGVCIDPGLYSVLLAALFGEGAAGDGQTFPLVEVTCRKPGLLGNRARCYSNSEVSY
jgi:hypothetical protein